MDGSTLFAVIMGLILVGYGVLFLGGRFYLKQGFQMPDRSQGNGSAGAGSASAQEIYPVPPAVESQLDSNRPPPEEDQGSCRKEKVIMEQRTNPPWAREAVNSLDDFEMNMLYQNESDRELSTQLRNKLMSQRPLDWAGLPPSSSQFQAGLRESFQNATPTVPDDAKPFQAVSGDSMKPPDTAALEMEERKILQTYKPADATELVKKYDVDDVEKMIADIYDKRGLVPTVSHKKDTNVWEVVGTRRKDEKVVYEDEDPEAPASTGPVRSAGEATITVPPTAYDVTAAKDPFYDTSAPGGKTRTGKWNYQSWTPGLERMFAPTNETENWY
jgi:hypothetical protein